MYSLMIGNEDAGDFPPLAGKASNGAAMLSENLGLQLCIIARPSWLPPLNFATWIRDDGQLKSSMPDTCNDEVQVRIK
jgi:hypothetical protein